MKRMSGLLWFVLLFSMNSCVSYEKFSIEVFKPAKLTLPTDIKKVALVSRSLKYPNDTLQNYQANNYKLVKDKIRFNYDSLAITICMDSLAGCLQKQNRFDNISIVPVNSFSLNRVKEIRPAKNEWYSNLTQKADVDGLILLDMFSCFYSKSNTNATPIATVITSNIWSFYDSRQQKIIDRFVQIDTLYWDCNDDEGNYKKLQIPEKKEAISLASGVIGENYSKHILPSWSKVYRDIMVCNKPDLEQAAKLAKNNKWTEATVIWQNYVESNNKRDQIISLYNLALSNEMNGEIDQAIQLTDRAAQISSGAFRSAVNEAIRKYSVVLYQRKNEINALNKQHEPQ